MNKKKIVQVTWLDAAHADDDLEEKEIDKLEPMKMVSFGLLIVDNEERVTISGHVGTNAIQVWRNSGRLQRYPCYPPKVSREC